MFICRTAILYQRSPSALRCRAAFWLVLCALTALPVWVTTAANAQDLELVSLTADIAGDDAMEAPLQTAVFQIRGADWWTGRSNVAIVLTGTEAVPAESAVSVLPPAGENAVPEQAWSQGSPFPQAWGPGSYVPEAPHRRLGRFLGAGFIDLFRHPPILAHDLLQPMLRESWLFRPLSAGWFMGMASGSELEQDWVDQRQGYFYGYRFGWDVDDFWGFETRFGFASVMTVDSDRAKIAQQAADDAAGIPADSVYRDRYDAHRDDAVMLWDVDLLYYPQGDAPCRPYALIGLGICNVYYVDRLGWGKRQNRLGLPLAIGLKWRSCEALAWRIELSDNMGIGFGNGPDLLHEMGLTAGLEVRFGGTRTAYWPWNPGRYYR